MRLAEVFGLDKTRLNKALSVPSHFKFYIFFQIQRFQFPNKRSEESRFFTLARTKLLEINSILPLVFLSKNGA